MKRRLFSLFLALTLVVGMLPAPAFAQETEPTQVTEAPTEAPATEAPATEAPAAEPTPAPTEALAPETTVAPAPTEAPTEPAPTEDEAVTAVQAMIDALPDVDHMSEEYLDALEEAYSAYETLSESQQAQITGVEKLEALFNWVNSQVSTLADDVKEISGEVTWDNKTFTTPFKLIGDTTLTLVGDNKIECDAPLDLNDCNLTIKGTGSLTVVGNGRSDSRVCNGAIFDSGYNGTGYGTGTLCLESGTVKASGGDYNAISVRSVELQGGKLEANGGSRAGIVCSYLYTYGGSLYATGDVYGIDMRTMNNAYNPGNLPILASDERDADLAAMDVSDMTDIQDNGSGNKTYYIGKVTGPMFSVKAQKGYLYEGVADRKATFAISAKNVHTDTLNAQWEGDHSGLTESLSTDGETLTVTTDATVKKGTYSLTVTVTGTDETTVTKTVTVTVLGAPVTVTTQPKDASVSCKGGDLDSWQGVKKIQVTATRAEGLTEDITYQWKLGDDTVLDGFNQPTLSLMKLYNDNAGKLTPVANKSWLHSAQVHCTLTVGTYSVDTKTVTLTVNICAHDRANPDGNCQQCGEPCSSEPLLVREDGIYYAVQDTSGIGAANVGVNLVVGGTFYLTKDVIHRSLDATFTPAGDKDVILDLQKHTLESLDMGNFPVGSITLKNGTLNQCIRSTATEGKLILDDVTFGDACWQAASNDYLDITVRGKTVFQAKVSFSSYEDVVHLQGGTFQEGINVTTGEEALALLDDGYAYQDSDGKIVDASYAGNIDGIKIRVVAHTCKYVNGKCECGRTCDHVGKVNADGYCTVCHALVEPYAIGDVRYTSLEAALDDANAGDTITLRGDFYQGSKTVEINKSVTLNLGDHTLTGDADGAPVLRVLAENVTIRNGTVENTRTAKSSPAVTVGKLDACAGLTVKSVTFIGSATEVTPRASALSVQSSNVAKVENGTFTGGIYVEGSLTMTGGSATSLELGPSQGKAELSGGSFDSIHFDADADYLGLLADGYAYQSGTSLVKLADMDSNTTVQIVKCTHPDGLTADTACPYCGTKCGHENTSKETGLCPDCGYQAYRAKIGDTLYETAQAALDAATDRQRVTLLANDTLPDNYVLDKVITLDMNAKKLTGSAMTVTGEVTVPSSGMLDVPMEITGKLTLNGPAATLLQDVSVRASGTLILDRSTAAVTGTISVYENGRFELRDGSIGKLHIDGGTATLSAGRIMRSVTVKNGNLQSILAEGKALLLKADGTVIDGTRSAALGNMEIVDHTHTFGEGGKCACGQTAPVQVVAGTESIYYVDFESAVNKAVTLPGSTVRLLKDVTLSGDSSIYIEGGTFTIDWNGHTLSGSFWGNLLTISGPANVTLKDGSNTNTGGVRHTGYGAAVCIAVGSKGIAKIQGGIYSPNVTRSQYCYGSVQISGGVFENTEGDGQTFALYDLGDRPLSQMLADGTAFAYEADGSELLDAYHVNKSDSFRTVYAVAHTHENFDENGVCDCGYPCPHTEVDKWGDCILCGKEFYVRGTYANGTTHYYGTLSDALKDPAVTKAVMIRSFGPVCESWDGGDRSVTLDLNGIDVVVKSIQGGHLILRDSSGSDNNLGMAEILKDGQVSVESVSVVPQAETLSVYGKLTVTGGYVESLTAMEGSTVSLSGGEVDSLTAMEGSTVSLSGGSFEKIVGGGVTLRSLLAKDCYYAELNGETPKDYADTDTVIEGVSVALCDHTSVRENKGTYFTTYTCNCGKVTYLLTVTVGESDKKYFGDYNTGFAYAAKNDGVVRFLTNGVNGTIEVNAQGTVTIDMENRSYSAGDRSLVIKSGSTVRLVGQGCVMSTPEPGSGSSGSSGTPTYNEFIPVTVESGGTFVLPAKKLGGGENMAKLFSLTVQSGGTAELQGGSTDWTYVYGNGTLHISGGNHGNIHQYDQGQLNITGGDIKQLQIYGDLPRNALSGGSYGTISAWESNPRESETGKLRNVTFDDFQNMLASGKVFQNTTNQSYPNQVETDGNYGFYYYKKDLSNVRVTAAPFTGVEVVCQLGADTYEEKVSTQYNVGETDSSGNVVFRLGVRTQPQEIQSGVTVQWYQLGAEDSRTLVGTGLTCPLDRKLPVGTHRFLAVVNCSGYVLESQPFAVTVTPRVVNITGGFTAQDRDYAPDETTVTITKGTVTFDKKAEGDDLGAQVSGGTVATPEAGQNKAVTYSATLTGEDKDNYTLGSQPELTVTIRPASQTLTFAETAVTKTYGDSPFVNALDHSAGDGPIIYASSDPAVARVGIDGKVTILKTGTAKITATAGATQNYGETSASFDLTVDKAAGTVTNKSYGLTYYYGFNLMPQASDFTADSTGDIHFEWTQDGKTVTPRDAGTYTLTVTVDGDENYEPASLVLTVTICKSSNIGKAVDSVQGETVFGKNDGLVKLSAPAENCEYRVKGETEYRNIPGDPQGKTLSLAVGTYEFRLKETKNYNPTPAETVTIGAGSKLTVTLPSPQTGYTLTADKVELSWHDSVTLTLTLETGYYRTASLAIKAGDRVLVFTEDKGTYTLTNVEEDLTITLEGVEKDEKAPSLALQMWIFGQGAFQGMAGHNDWADISTATAPYYVLSARGNYFAVEASDGETGLASVSYLLSGTALPREALEQAAWEPVPEESLNQAGPDREHMIQLGLGEWYFYVKAVDKAGNVSYVGSDKLIREENAPTFGGVTKGATYYTTQKVTITDDYALMRYLAPGSKNWKDISGTSYEVTLEGNREGTYTMEAEDACQNTSTLTVYMKPISSLTEEIRDLTEDNVRKSDLDQLTQAEKALKALDTTNATDEEKKIITEALDSIGTLKAVLEEVTQVEAMIAALPDSVEPYQQTVEDTQIKPARQAYSDLTDHQKTLVDSTKLDKLVRLEAQLNAWTITEGDGQTWFKGSWNPLSFTVNGQTRKFSKVLLDGKMYITATPSFLAVSGSTDEPFTLTLKPEFLQVSMEPGEHTLTVIYGENNSRTGTVTFTVEIPANYLDATNKPEFDGKTTVTVDGAEYPIEEMNGTRYVNLPETGDLLTIYSFKDGTPAGSYTNYPTGMQVFRITRQEGGAKAEELTEFANLLNYAGCSIRLTGTKGIRMITGISENARTALIGAQGLAGYTLEEYGTVVMRGVGTPTLENSNSHNFAYKKGKADPVFARAGGMIQYTNVLVGFSLEDCKDTLTLRPYIKLKDTTTGETVTLYGGCVCRSIGYIAKQNENTYKPGTAGYKYIHEILNYTQTAEQGGKTK